MFFMSTSVDCHSERVNINNMNKVIIHLHEWLHGSNSTFKAYCCLSRTKVSCVNSIIMFQEEHCENAYFKMDNVLIDDRRIHVDFSQSVAKVKWKGKGMSL